MIQLLDFNLFSPQACHFLNLYKQAASFEDERVHILSSFLSDLMLLSYESLHHKSSLIASACLFVAAETFECQLSEDQLEVCREYFNWYSREEFQQCAQFVRRQWIETRVRNSQVLVNYEAVHNKYDEHREMLEKEADPQPFNLRRFREWFYSEEAEDMTD